MNRDVDIKSPEEAAAVIAEHAKRETARVALTQGLQRLNGGTDSTVGDLTPQQNGAMGAKAQ